MLAQLKTVGLIKEAIKRAFFRLVEYLEHQHVWVRLQAQKETNNFLLKLVSLFLFWEMKTIPCQKLPRNWWSCTTLCTTPFTEHCKLALTRLERGVGGPSAQLSKRTSTLECLQTHTKLLTNAPWNINKIWHIHRKNPRHIFHSHTKSNSLSWGPLFRSIRFQLQPREWPIPQSVAH